MVTRALHPVLIGASCALWAALPAAGATPADFELASLAGEFVTLSDLAPRVTVLNFWRSDCPPCVRELPMLEGFAAAHPDVRVIAVAAQPRSITEARYPAPHASLVVLVGPSTPEALMRRFGAVSTGIPYTAVLRPDRTVCARQAGEITETWLTEQTHRCLR